MLTLSTLLGAAEVPLDQTLIVRHTPEPALRRTMPWLVSERPDLFNLFQSIQSPPLEAAMTRAQFVASFLENGAGSAIFSGLYRIDGHRRVTYDEYWAIPGHQELCAFGMNGQKDVSHEPLLFTLSQAAPMTDWIGRLCVSWPGLGRSWWRWADRAHNEMPVTAIHAESRFAQEMPPWESIVLSWSELQVLPTSWRARLAEWRGIYLIFDVARSAGYVGSACGEDNILGRWRNYGATGHGGNARLRKSDPLDLRFSILQRTSPDLPAQDVVRLEGYWKERLHTRRHGLNAN